MRRWVGIGNRACMPNGATLQLSPEDVILRDGTTLRLRGTTPTGRLGEVLEVCSVLPDDLADHDVLPDFDAAEALVGQLAST